MTLAVSSLGIVAAPAQAAIACKDVLFLGARGSGEPLTQAEVKKGSGQVAGYGSTVDQVRAQVLSAATTKGLSIEAQYLPYPAESTDVLKKFDWGYPTGITTYFSGLEIGVGAAITALDLRHTACPNEQIVLAGYSQGAMVMHRLVNQLDSTYLSRTGAVVLIADGDQVGSTVANRLGSAPLSNVGLAEYARKTGLLDTPIAATGLDLPPVIAHHAMAVCNDGDLICDFTADLLKNGGTRSKAISVHTAYASSTLPRDAGVWAGQQLVSTRADVEGVSLTWVSPPVWQWSDDLDGPSGPGYLVASTARIVTTFPLASYTTTPVYVSGVNAAGGSAPAFLNLEMLSGTNTDGVWAYSTAFPGPASVAPGTYTVNQVCLETPMAANVCRTARPSEVVTFTIP